MIKWKCVRWGSAAAMGGLAAILILATAVSADVLVGKNGARWEGTVTEEGDRYVLVTVSGGRMTFAKSDVAEVISSEDPPASPSAALVEAFKLTSSDPAARDGFACSASIDGERVIVGACLQSHAEDGVNRPASGAAYVYDATTGEQLFKLTASDVSRGDLFGYSVAISRDKAVVGAISNDDAGSGSGAAYVFDITTGEQLFKLTASDAAAGANFGYSVSISGDKAIVGAQCDSDSSQDERTKSGSAYVFDVTTGEQLFKLTAPSPAADDHFGSSVSISGDKAIVGAPYYTWQTDSREKLRSGEAHVFDVTSGEHLFTLTYWERGGRLEMDHFGCSVSISGDRAIVGTWCVAWDTGVQGAAVVFDITTGERLYELTSPSPAADHYFGTSVSISGDKAIVSAYWLNLPEDWSRIGGPAYVFDLTTRELLCEMTPSDNEGADLFGDSVLLSGDKAVVIAPGWDSSEVDYNSGAAYLFDISQGPTESEETPADDPDAVGGDGAEGLPQPSGVDDASDADSAEQTRAAP